MNRRNYRDSLRLLGALCCFMLYIPHYLVLTVIGGGKRSLINNDLKAIKGRLNINIPPSLQLLYWLHNNRYFRNLFYHRVGPVIALLIGWWRPGDRYFVISKTTMIGEGAYFAHPFATEINAKSIGRNFSCRHLTTIGNKRDGDNDHRPVIGDNVTLGVNVTIIGNVTIGNNVTIGAGSVVVKDIPDNCVAVGNPCRVIKSIDNSNK